MEPRAAWATVILIAAIGFVNYILWKIYGAKGVEISGFLGGLVNSTVAANGAVLAAVASVFVNLPLVMRVAHRKPLTARLRFAFGVIMATGLLGVLAQSFLLPPLLHFFTRR